MSNLRRVDLTRLANLLEHDVYACLESGPPVGVKPEAWTLEKVIDPILNELGYLRQFREPEFKPGQDSPGWVDRLLKDANLDPAVFVEAKSMRERDLWKRHRQQVYEYINSYRLSPGADEVKTVRWSILTNGTEWLVLNNLERRPQPFRVITLSRDAEADAAALAILARDNLDALLNNYNESRNIPLGVQFVEDLRTWRQHLATELATVEPSLSDRDIADYSQHILDQIIFIRVLETTGLQPSFGLLKLYATYDSIFRNRKAVPFGVLLTNLLEDLEADLNTELLKQVPSVVARLPQSSFEPIIMPDSSAPGVALIQNSVYNYDFRDLTFDLLGEVYEQYLSHVVQRDGTNVSVTSSRNLRGSQGAFYTPAPVVKFATAIGLRSISACDDPETLLGFVKALRIVDIACGSGAFLLAAFRLLMSERTRYEHLAYTGSLTAGTLSESFPTPHSIVADHLFGIDSDSDAVEVARLNLWLELIKAAPMSLRRSQNGKDQLPHLGNHVVSGNSIQEESLDRYFDIFNRLGIPNDARVVVLGNPPWGADLSGYVNLSERYESHIGSPPESAALFVERIVTSLRDGDAATLVLPDSLLMRSQYAQLRTMLATRCRILDIVRLGEGFFPGVFRAAIILRFEKVVPSAHHESHAYIFTKRDRELAAAASGTPLIDTYDAGKWPIRQSHLVRDAERSWDIFVDDEDYSILSRLEREHDTVGDLLVDRGVELGQDGRAIVCADCGATVPTARKPKPPYEKKCDNCRRPMRDTSKVVQLINPTKGKTVPFVVGKDMHRLTVRRTERLSLDGQLLVPVCPNCSMCDAKLGVAKGRKRTCFNCGTTFSESTARKKRVGIKYKAHDLYDGEKVLLRQTGRGLYAALDVDSYCSQTIYVLRGEPKGVDPAYVAGVLSSRILLYVYYKRMGIVEWQSYPHLVMEFVRRLPFPKLDMNKEADKTLHDGIAAEARLLSRYPARPQAAGDDSVLEALVRRAFGLSDEESAHVDRTLNYIEQFGPLLGEVEDDDSEAELNDI